MSFAHLKKKFILEQWKNLASNYSTMTIMIHDILNVFSSEVVNERLFFIANWIYESHKSYHSSTIKVKMIIRHDDYKESVWEYDNAPSNLKKKEILNKKNI